MEKTLQGGGGGGSAPVSHRPVFRRLGCRIRLRHRLIWMPTWNALTGTRPGARQKHADRAVRRAAGLHPARLREELLSVTGERQPFAAAAAARHDQVLTRTWRKVLVSPSRSNARSGPGRSPASRKQAAGGDALVIDGVVVPVVDQTLNVVQVHVEYAGDAAKAALGAISMNR